MVSQLWLSVMAVISSIDFIEATIEGCHESYSVYGMFLKGHVIKEVEVGFPTECYMMCGQESRCQSYNVVIGKNICELNSRTKEARPKDFLPDRSRYYMKRAFNRAPLGSIKELPAESCSEIKASEGSTMTEFEHWIYADEDANQTIQAICQGVWQKINQDPVCFGSRYNKYGAFRVTKTGKVKAMKLLHRNGSIKCNPDYSESYWGCTNTGAYPSDTLMTIITNANKEAILPPAEELKARNNGEKHFYVLEGVGQRFAELVLENLPSTQLYFSRNQELQIWYGQDWADLSESNNSGTTCADVYVWYI
ncbi:uncharacterized protein [Montipora capricornis]|uniref:uncharacterized protein n=1 Tax=Montipora capricornis TaxID=246305 RepID=UPI0035F13F64